MRVTTNMMYDRNVSHMMKTTERLSKASEQMMTGERFTTAGEDPVAMAQKLDLTTTISRYQQYSSNGTQLESSLGLEEKSLDSIYSALSSAYTKVQQSVNSTNGTTDKEALATELEELQKQMLDLMNSKDSSGEYLFSGNLSQTEPFYKDSSGQYVYQGGSGQNYIQVSSTVKIASNDNGAGIFESVPTQRTATASSASISVSIDSQSTFDSFYRNNYDFDTAANNTYTVETTAGTPDQYSVKDAGGTVLQTGDYTQGADISFNGLTLNLDVAAGGATQSFALDSPKNDNILNTMSEMIAALRDPSTTTDQLTAIAAKTETHLTNTQDSVNSVLGKIGGRLNNLDAVMSSNDELTTLSKTTRANVSEIDLYEATTNATKENTALSMAQQAYSMISKTTLFNYL
jgi:flagellar hook-associated protein 3